MPEKKLSFKIKMLTAMGLLAVAALLAWFLLSGDNLTLLRHIFLEGYRGEVLQDNLQELGWRGYITVAILSMLQVVVAFLPAEPVQLIAGLSFGFWQGLLCCAAGVFLGNLIIFVAYRVYGEKMRDYFFKNLHLDFEKAAVSDVLTVIIFILYFLPAIPYGMICFFAASAGMKYPRYAVVTFLGSLPSICIGVGLGHMTIVSGWVVSLSIFAVLLMLLVVLMLNRERLFARINAYIDNHTGKNKNNVRLVPVGRLLLPYAISQLIIRARGLKIRYVDHVGDAMQKPCVVLCNHGSFIDFVHAGAMLRHYAPNFIVARLYFYKKALGELLRTIGCFPKSMFALDFESMKNSFRVLNNGGMLAMMPEARLSTVGRFEDIQPGSYEFFKKMGVSIYTITVRGDYLADPKWGDGIRRGAYVEATLELLYTADEVHALSAEQLGQGIEERLYYDEMAWLGEHPELRYRSKTLAKGLENILIECPRCGGKYTLTTRGRRISCECCGELATINDRYGFDENAPFANFVDWYDWQTERLKERMKSEDYALTATVTLRHPDPTGKHMLYDAGRGVCTLSREGLRYCGTQNGQEIDQFFPISQIYRLLFGAGEDFELYVGREIYYFVPDERRSAVEWYMASKLLSDQAKAMADGNRQEKEAVKS
ncbi:MAG: VTT domain-containing protein [Clostridia bacterium]|nr:VTT domain-containing protein [Clostridia bacterium]